MIFPEIIYSEWKPLLIRIGELNDEEFFYFRVSEEIFVEAGSVSPTNTIIQQSYGLNEVKYSYFIEQPLIFIENEIYFPGWTARLVGEDEIIIEAFPVNEVFRGWKLPPGNFEMIARFELPNQKMYSNISIMGLVLWMTCSIVWFKDLQEKK
jgi:hypothetical protein